MLRIQSCGYAARVFILPGRLWGFLSIWRSCLRISSTQKLTSVHIRFFLMKATLFAFLFSSQLQRRLHVDRGRRRRELLYRTLLNSQFGRREASAGLIIIIWPILSIAYTPSLSLSPCDGRHIMNSFQFMNYVQTDACSGSRLFDLQIPRLMKAKRLLSVADEVM